jgi:hypothetical protein
MAIPCCSAVTLHLHPTPRLKLCCPSQNRSSILLTYYLSHYPSSATCEPHTMTRHKIVTKAVAFSCFHTSCIFVVDHYVSCPQLDKIQITSPALCRFFSLQGINSPPIPRLHILHLFPFRCIWKKTRIKRGKKRGRKEKDD